MKESEKRCGQVIEKLFNVKEMKKEMIKSRNEKLWKEFLIIWSKVVIIMWILLFTHELGHLMMYLLMGVSDWGFGIDLPYIYLYRWQRFDLIGEIMIRLMGPWLLNIISLLLIRRLKKSMFFPLSIFCFIIVVPLLTIWDFTLLLEYWG